MKSQIKFIIILRYTIVFDFNDMQYLFLIIYFHSLGQTRTRAGHEQQIAAYLSSNPNFLEKYVLRNVDLDTLERWTIRRARNLQNQNAPNGGNLLMFQYEAKNFII